MRKRMKLLLSEAVLIVMILSMATPVFSAETEPTTEHTHTWRTLSASSSKHYLACTGCNETLDEPHTFNSEEICVVCGRYFHTHKWQRTAADSQFHTVVCTVCGESQTVTHSMDGDVCTVCGYETHTHIMEYAGGECYQHEHVMHCTLCDATGIEEHTYGSDDKCTVCGMDRPCDHQWVPNGEQYYDQHVLACTCGQTMHEPHSWTWNSAGQYAICTVCETREGHWHKYVAPDGSICIECGYDRSTRGPEAPPSGTGSAGTGPAATEPVETEPAETEPAATEPIVTEPAATEPTETESAETEPAETNPEEGIGSETDPPETEPETSEAVDKEDENADAQPEGSTPIWIAAVVTAAVALTAGLFLWKKKSA